MKEVLEQAKGADDSPEKLLKAIDDYFDENGQ